MVFDNEVDDDCLCDPIARPQSLGALLMILMCHIIWEE